MEGNGEKTEEEEMQKESLKMKSLYGEMCHHLIFSYMNCVMVEVGVEAQ